MPLNGAIVKKDATSLSVTGGTDQTFSPDGVQVSGGIHLADMAEADIRIRRQLTIKNKASALNADGTWSKDRRSITLVSPITLTSGKTSFPLIRIEVESHPENTAAARLDLALMGAQFLSDADFASYLAGGNLS
jgi:hypothetical protein